MWLPVGFVAGPSSKLNAVTSDARAAPRSSPCVSGGRQGKALRRVDVREGGRGCAMVNRIPFGLGCASVGPFSAPGAPTNRPLTHQAAGIHAIALPRGVTACFLSDASAVHPLCAGQVEWSYGLASGFAPLCSRVFGRGSTTASSIIPGVPNLCSNLQSLCRKQPRPFYA